MARDIKGLLSKKGWTGEEVGKAIIANLVNDVRHLGEECTPLFTQTELERMENSLTKVEERIAYGVYRDIYSATVDTFNKGQAMHQQFYNGYYRAVIYLKQAMDADHALKDMERYPLIMTESQYKRILDAETAAKRSVMTCYRSIVFGLLRYYIEVYDSTPEEVPSAILEAIKAAAEQPVTNKRILENYCGDEEEGYYTLADGRRSDQMSREEWEAACEEEYFASHKLTINGEPASNEETRRYYTKERTTKAVKLLFEGVDNIKEAIKKAGMPLPALTDDEIFETLEEVANGESTTEKEQALGIDFHESYHPFHTYSEPPKNLSKLDILTSECSIIRYMGWYADRLLDGQIVPDVTERQAFKEFMNDYPEIYAALKADIEARIPQAKGLKANQYGKELISLGELADLKIAYYIRLTEVNDYDIIDYYCKEDSPQNYSNHKRMAFNGIAILRSTNAFNAGENDVDYKEKENLYKDFMSLDSISENEDDRTIICGLQPSLCNPALRYLYAYNTLVTILAQTYDIEDLAVIQHDTRPFESQAENYNSLLYMFFKMVYGSKEEKHRKRELILQIFKPFDTEALKPTEQAIKTVTAEIRKLGLTKAARKKLSNFDHYIAILMDSGKGAEE